MKNNSIICNFKIKISYLPLITNIHSYQFIFCILFKNGIPIIFFLANQMHAVKIDFYIRFYNENDWLLNSKFSQLYKIFLKSCKFKSFL